MLEISRCNSRDAINSFVGDILARSIGRMPLSKGALILIKPNFNSDMTALSGNTTDLRLIISVAQNLKLMGYSNIVIGDGTSSGFINAGIDVLGRLGVKRLCERWGIKCIDFNFADYKEVNFLGASIKIASVCFEAGFFINLPKLKTHAEAAMSACLKNLIGCAVGRDKQKVHASLDEGILELNKILRPHLHIVDAIVSMEGTGPSRGKPKLTGRLVAGDDGFATDAFLADFCGIGYKRVGYLRLARDRGFLGEVPQERAPVFKFLEPRPGRLFKIINSPSLRKFFAFVRYLPVANKVFSSSLLSGPLYFLGMRQDFFNKTDDHIERIRIDAGLCDGCGRCARYCPQGINIPQVKEPFPGCLKCFYCYFICPREAVRMEGGKGYLDYQVSHYKRLIAERLAE